MHFRTQARPQAFDVTDFRKAVAAFPMIPALKATIGLATGERGWERVRPPLTPLGEADLASLSQMLDGRGFAMPGRRDIA